MFLVKLLCHLLPVDVQIPNKLKIPPVPAHADYNSSSSPPWKRSELVQHLVSASRPLPFGRRLRGHLSVCLVPPTDLRATKREWAACSAGGRPGSSF